MISSMMVQGVRWYIHSNDANGHVSVAYGIEDHLISQLVPVPPMKRTEYQLRVLKWTMANGQMAEAKAIAGRTIRDKQLTNQLLACRSARDFKSCQATVDLLIARPELRFAEGICAADLVPRTQKVVLMDVIGALSDLGARWLPYDVESQPYVRATDQIVDDQTIFTADEAEENLVCGQLAVPISTPVSSQRGTLLSFSVRVPGSVKINRRAALRCNLPLVWKCNEHRRFAMAMDGRSRYDYIIVEIDDENTSRLAEYSDVLSFKIIDGNRYRIKLPQDVVDQTRQTVSASDLYELFRQHVSLDYQKRAVSFYLRRFSDAQRSLAYMNLVRRGSIGPVQRRVESWRPSKLSNDAMTVLRDHGINSSNNYIGINRKVGERADPQQPLYNANLTGFSSPPDISKITLGQEQTTRSRKLMAKAMEMYQNCDAETLIQRQYVIRQNMTNLRLRQFELMSYLMFNHARVIGTDLVEQTLDKVVINSSRDPKVQLTIKLNQERIEVAKSDSLSIKDQIELKV